MGALGSFLTFAVTRVTMFCRDQSHDDSSPQVVKLCGGYVPFGPALVLYELVLLDPEISVLRPLTN
jgi:hypothetical protein